MMSVDIYRAFVGDYSSSDSEVKSKIRDVEKFCGLIDIDLEGRIAMALDTGKSLDYEKEEAWYAQYQRQLDKDEALFVENYVELS